MSYINPEVEYDDKYKDDFKRVTLKGKEFRLHSGPNHVEAHYVTPKGNYLHVGSLHWFGYTKPSYESKTMGGGVISGVGVHKNYQHHGVASAMLDFARERHPHMDIRHSFNQTDDGKAWAEKKAGLIDDYRWEQDAQNRRAEKETQGHRSETNSYFGDDKEGDAREKRLNFKDYLKRNETTKEGDAFAAQERAHRRGHELGQHHLANPDLKVDNEDMNWEAQGTGHPDHFWNGYSEGLGSSKVAVLISGMDDAPPGLVVTAHVSGNSIDVLHCPFCGSGAVIARSDGTVECGYCTSVFTVQVQPAYNGFPQSVDGQPYNWPGMPDPNAVAAPDTPMGPNPLDGGVPGDPTMGDEGDEEAPPFGDSEDGEAAPEEDSGDDSGSSDKKDSKGGNPFAKKKSKLATYRTIAGAELDADAFIQHLAIKYARNPLEVAQSVRKSNQSSQ